MIEEEKLQLCSWFHLWIFTGFTHKLPQTFVIYKDHTSSLRKPAKGGPEKTTVHLCFGKCHYCRSELLFCEVYIYLQFQVSIQCRVRWPLVIGCLCFSLQVCQNGTGNKNSFFFGVCVTECQKMMWNVNMLVAYWGLLFKTTAPSHCHPVGLVFAGKSYWYRCLARRVCFEYSTWRLQYEKSLILKVLNKQVQR